MPKCVCGHDFTEHAREGTPEREYGWECLVEGCDCEKFEQGDAD